MQKLLYLLLFLSFGSFLDAQHSVARQWNEEILEAIRHDFARPTVHARNLFHPSIAMYDIWAVVKEEGSPFFLGDTVGTYISQFPGLELVLTDEEEEAYIEEAISFALYDLIRFRFQFSPGGNEIFNQLDSLMNDLGYNVRAASGAFPGDDSAIAFGRYVAQELIIFGLQDGSNEQFDYRNLFYEPVNEPILVLDTGNFNVNDPNRWQPLAFDIFIDQAGNEIIGNIPEFLSPEWGAVIPFALTDEDKEVFQGPGGSEYIVYHDPGPPPYLSEEGTDAESADFRWGFMLVAIWSSMLDPSDGVMWDISPASIGNIEDLPDDFDGYRDFYKLFEGGDASIGHPINPITSQPYTPQIVPRADYARVLAEFWADGPDSETPPGHWFTIIHTVMDDPAFERKWQGQGAELDDLEFDIKAFFTLSGAMHDAAVSTWGIKGWYDYGRPVSVIRYMASKGQSSDSAAANYDPHGLPIIPEYIEVIEQGDPLAGVNDEHLGKMKIYGWRGPGAIENPELDVAGVGWTLAENWWPYQRPTFVSPPFAGYTSGHSCFSRAAAEILTMMTGDEFFPGGMGVFPAPMNEFLVFEDGPSVDINLQWATYRDASDQTSLSRIWGGIHPPQDDIPGRIIGIDIGIDAFNKANTYFGVESTSTYEETIIENKFEVYPNPLSSHDRLHIKTLDNTVQNVRIELFDIQSRRVRSEIIRTSQTSLDMTGLSPGKYVVHLISDGFRQISDITVVY